ncbi:MAG TPA: DMT family transporter [Candidatus Cloacimonadota bacterium]|nr:DMT family transporter [Candidatus Cloacimonadota bacterium]
MKKSQLSYLYAGLTILAWSTVSTSFKLSLIALSPIGLLFVSSLTAVLFLGAVNLFTEKSFIPGGTAALRSNLKRSLLPGLLNPWLYYVMLFIAYDRLRAQEAQVLNYTWAIVLSLLSIIILKERFRLRDLLALLLSFLGVMVLSTKGRISTLHFDDPLGSGIALATSIVWAGYWILSLKDGRKAQHKLFYNFLVGFIATTILVLVYQITGTGSLLNGSGKAPLPSLLAAVYTGIFEMGLTFLLWYKALSLAENTARVSNLIFITPFLSLIFIRLILAESIHPATLVGLLLIVCSNLWQRLGSRSS